jgi:hypothetical protein
MRIYCLSSCGRSTVGDPPAGRLKMGLTTSQPKKSLCYTWPLTWTDCLERPTQRKMGMNFGT